MANYPQLDNASGVWNLREVYDAVMGGYWPNYNSIGLVTGVDQNAGATVDKVTIASTGNATVFGNLTSGRAQLGGAGSLTRALFFGGNSPGTLLHKIKL